LKKNKKKLNGRDDVIIVHEENPYLKHKKNSKKYSIIKKIFKPIRYNEKGWLSLLIIFFINIILG